MTDPRMLAAVTAETAMPQSSHAAETTSVSGKNLRWVLKAFFCCLSISALLLTAPRAAAQTDFGSVAVGSSTTMSVTITYTGTDYAETALTMGKPQNINPEFTFSNGTCSGITHSCTDTVIFTPHYSGERLGALVVFDSSYNPTGITYLKGYGAGPQLAITPFGSAYGINTTLPNATLQGVVVDGAGNIYTTESYSGDLLKWVPGAATDPEHINLPQPTVVVPGCVGSATTNCFGSARGVVIDGAGNLYVTDAGNIGNGNGGAAQPGVYKLSRGYHGAYSDPVPISGPTDGWRSPAGIAIDTTGKLYVMDNGPDPGNQMHDLYSLALQTGGSYATPYAETSFFVPIAAIAVDAANNFYSVNAVAKQVRKNTGGPTGANNLVYTSTGTTMTGVAVDGNGNVFISDSAHQITEVTPQSGGLNATSFNPGAVLQTSGMCSASAIAVDGAGSIYYVDGNYLLFFKTIGGWEGYSQPYSWGTVNPISIQITNNGNENLILNGVDTTAAPDFEFVQTGTVFPNLCTTSTSLASGASCTLEVDFDPLASSLTTNPTELWENVTLTSNDVITSPTSISILGVETGVATSLVLSSSANPALTNVPVTLTANLTGLNAQKAITGTVAFKDGGNTITGCGTVSLNTGVATCDATFTAAGQQSITASYTGDAFYSSTNSATYQLSVVVPPDATASGLTAFGSSAAPIAVGQNVTETVTFTFSSAVTLQQIQTLTQGAAGQEFSVASGGSCATGSSYGPSGTTTCTVNVTFTPAHPGIRNGAVTLSDGSNQVVATAYLQGYSSGVQFAVAPAATTYTKTLSNTQWESVAVDGAGNIFAAVSISGGTAIYKMTPSVTGGTLSYSQTEVYSTGTDGTGTGSSIQSVAVDGAGNLVFIDGSQGVILLPRQADGSYPAYTAAVTVGFRCGNGNATNCLVDPVSVAVDGVGNIYVADNANSNLAKQAVYKLTLSNGLYSVPTALPLPSGGYAQLDGVVVDGAGSVYSLDNSTREVYRSNWSGTAYSTPTAMTVGSDPTNYVNNYLNNPQGIAADGLGNIYIADYSGGIVQFVPNGSGYNSIKLGTNYYLSKVAVDASGNVYAANSYTLSVYSTTTPAALDFGHMAVGDAPGTESVEIVSTGNAALDLTALSFPADFPSYAAGTTCSASSVLTQGQSCMVKIEFVPTVADLTLSQPLSEQVTITSNASPATITIPVSGTVTKASTRQAVTVSASPIVIGASATVTATVTGVTGLASPTGTVTFSIGSTTLCSAVALQGGVATCSSSPQAAGSVTVQAAYSGDALYFGNNSSITVLATNPPDATPSVPVTSFTAETVRSSESSVVTINFSASLSAPVTLGAINVLTQGVLNLDYNLSATQADTGACTVGHPYAAGSSCTVTVTFMALVNGLRVGAVVLADNSSSANVVATAYLTGTGNGPLGSYLPGTLSSPFLDGDVLSHPTSLAIAGMGTLFITDSGNAAVYEVNNSSTPAQITGNNLHFGVPESIALDGAGNLYVADSGEGQAGQIPAVYLLTLQPDGSYTQTPLGTGWQYPSGVAVDGSGNVYVVDNGSDSVIELTPSNGTYTQTTVATSLSNPGNIAVDTNSNLYVTNNGSEVSTGTVVKLTLAGSSYTQSTLGSGWEDPEGVAVDSNGNLYVADDGSDTVTKLTLQSNGSYTQTTLVPSESLSGPTGVALFRGEVFVTTPDEKNIRRIDLTDPSQLSFNNTSIGWTSTDSPQTATYANVGNQPLTISALSYPTDFPEFSPAPAGVCTASTQLAANAECTFPVAFTPITPQSSYPVSLAEAVTFTSNAIGITGPQQIGVFGSVTSKSVQVSLATSTNSIWVDGPAPTFTATITIPSTVAMPAPTGNITFATGNLVLLCSPAKLTAVPGSSTSWTATCTPTVGVMTTNFPVGVVGVIASIVSDSNYAFTISNAVHEYVLAAAPSISNFNDTSIGSTNVGSSVACIPLTITFNASETLGGIQVLTAGSPNGDLSQGTSCTAPSPSLKTAQARPMTNGPGAALCAIGSSYNQGDSCIVNVNFTPSFAGTRNGAVLLTDSSTPANIIGTGYLQGTGVGPQTIFAVPFNADGNSKSEFLTSPEVSRAVSEATPGPLTPLSPYSLGLLPSSQSTIGTGWNTPYGVAVDGGNNIYIADGDNHSVTKETYSKVNGVVSYTGSTIGTGWTTPAGVAVDGAGNVYVADTGTSGNGTVVKETLQPGGTYVASFVDNIWTTPTGVAVDGSGNVFVADASGFVIKESLIGGAYFNTWEYEGFNSPSGIAVDGGGNVYVTDPNGDEEVFKLTPLPDGTYTTTGINGRWYSPYGIAVDANGNLYVADPGRGDVMALTLSNGNYTSVQIGNFDYPYELALTPSGNLIVADPGSNEGGLGLNQDGECCDVKAGGSLHAAARPVHVALHSASTPSLQKNFDGGGNNASTTPSVYMLDFADAPQLSFATTATNATSTDSPQTVEVINFGNAKLNFSALTYPTDFPEASGVTTDCTATSQVAASGTCTLSVAFTPVTLSTTSLTTLLSENVSLTTNALNTTDAQQVAVSGTETQSKLPAATPSFSIPSGTLATAQTTIYLTDATSGAVLYYTVDGSTPTSGSTLYTSAGISVAASETIKAIAVVSGYNNSAVATAAYTINIPSNPTAATPTFSPAGGTYTSAQTVYLSDTTSGAVLYYTTNGSTPTSGSTLYTSAGISVAASETIKAIAVVSGYNNSAVATAAYTINASTPTGNFTITTAGANQTVVPGGAGVYTLNLTPANGASTFQAAVTFSVSGLPPGATVSFSPASIAAGAGATSVTMTIQTAQLAAANNPPADGFLASRLAPLSLALLLLPFAAPLRKSGKRLSRLLTVLLLLGVGAALAGLSACGSGAGFFGQAQKTYTVTVTATMGTVSNTSNVTLTVE
jgi:sugar lactone lactonase YvrE